MVKDDNVDKDVEKQSFESVLSDPLEEEKSQDRIRAEVLEEIESREDGSDGVLEADHSIQVRDTSSQS